MSESLLQVENLSKRYELRHLWQRRAITAVEGVDFSLPENRTLGLVGESGCGKTTIGKSILKLIPVSGGSIRFRGEDITDYSPGRFRPFRKHIQMIFQDLDAALNPRMRIRDILLEAIDVHHRGINAAESNRRMLGLLEQVNLRKNKLGQFPSELSGGEKRRVGIAKVLAVEPQLIVADEPTSALDVSIQAQVVNLMMDLQQSHNLSYLFITHDLQLVELMSHRVAVMYRGKIVEIGPATDIARHPKHPYTSVLWSSQVERENKEASVRENNTEGGCAFASRCPVYADSGMPEACSRAPELKPCASDHWVACHFPN